VSTIRVRLEYPCEYPCEYPLSTPRLPLAYPSSTPRVRSAQLDYSFGPNEGARGAWTSATNTAQKPETCALAAEYSHGAVRTRVLAWGRPHSSTRMGPSALEYSHGAVRTRVLAWGRRTHAPFVGEVREGRVVDVVGAVARALLRHRHEVVDRHLRVCVCVCVCMCVCACVRAQVCAWSSLSACACVRVRGPAVGSGDRRRPYRSPAVSAHETLRPQTLPSMDVHA
jgi:hypothetical protein